MRGAEKRVGKRREGRESEGRNGEYREGEKEGGVENLFHLFMGDRRPCLTAVNTVFLRFGVTQTTFGWLLLVANFLYRS